MLNAVQEVIRQIQPVSQETIQVVKKRWNTLAKPPHSLGHLEDSIARLLAICPTGDIQKRCVCVMCADNGVLAEGVASSPQEVTTFVAELMVAQASTVCLMAQCAGAEVKAFDIGMGGTVPQMLGKKIAFGTKNFTQEPAMTRTEALEALLQGVQIAKDCKEAGYALLLMGELGMGNTTTSSALTAVLCDVPVAEVTGRGAGLDDAGLVRKIHAIETAIAKHKPDPHDPLDILSKLGGFDIAALCGLVLGAASLGLPVVLDGFISYVSALLAKRFAPHSADYLLPSHQSAEPATRLLLDTLGVGHAPLDLQMALGEGTGAVAVLPLLDMGLKVYQNLMVLYPEEM